MPMPMPDPSVIPEVFIFPLPIPLIPTPIPPSDDACIGLFCNGGGAILKLEYGAAGGGAIAKGLAAAGTAGAA